MNALIALIIILAVIGVSALVGYGFEMGKRFANKLF